MSQKEPVTEHQAESYNRLRRLQTHSRSNIPALMAQRATSTFTLHDEPLPEEANEQVLVTVYPQDPFVGEPEVRTMNASDIQAGLINSRVRVVDNQDELATPDVDGNYLYWPGSPQFDQVNSFYFTTYTLRMYERYARRVLPWSFPLPRITIDPHFGHEANAFYSEQDRMLGFHSFEHKGQMVSTAWSADIVSHEAGHAILDGLRDLYNESFSLGPLAFHESFGDMSAMLAALHDDSLVRRLLEWTDGDLRRDSFITALAEQLIEVLQDGHDQEYLRTHSLYLRNAVNKLKFKPFDELPYTPADPELELGLRSHNYSRLFSGAFYDIFAGIFEFLNRTMPEHIAIYKARDIVAHLLVTAIELGPVGEFDFADMAKAFITAERVLYGGSYDRVLTAVFDERKLFSEDEIKAHQDHLKALPDIRLPETINTALASALFLEEKIMPAFDIFSDSQLIPSAAYRNASGYAYLTYFESTRVMLEGTEFKQFAGSKVDLFGGLSMMFDTNDRLCSIMYRPVTPDDIHQMKILTVHLIEENLVAETSVADHKAKEGTEPHAVAITNTDPDDASTIISKQLVKHPVTVDFMPAVIPSFVDYLHRLQSKSDHYN